MSTYDSNKLILAVMDLVEPAQYVNVNYGGCVSGAVGGLCYYKDTVAFHDEHETAIWDLVYQDMESMGETDNLMAFIASWNGSKDVGSMEQFKNLLTWYAVESIVRNLSDLAEADGLDVEDAEATEAWVAAQREERA